MNLTNVHGYAFSTPGLDQWVGDLELPWADSLDPALLWQCYRLAAVVLIWPLACSHDSGVALKRGGGVGKITANSTPKHRRIPNKQKQSESSNTLKKIHQIQVKFTWGVQGWFNTRKITICKNWSSIKAHGHLKGNRKKKNIRNLIKKLQRM